MFSAFAFALAVILSAVLIAVIYSIICGLFQTPEIPPTGATRSRTIQH